MQYIPEQCRALVSSIFIVALRDYQTGSQRKKEEILEFINSEYAERLASHLEQVSIWDIRERFEDETTKRY